MRSSVRRFPRVCLQLLRKVPGYRDQCESNPCQNGVKCKDAMSVYIFWCPPEFKNCDVEMVKQCDIYNGGCVVKAQHAVCDCAAGYELALEKSTCEPEGLFPCGHLSHVICSILSSRRIITAVNVDQTQHSYNDALNITVASLAVSATATPPPQQHQQHQQQHHQQHQQHQPLFLSARGPALLGLLPNNAHHPGRVVQRTAGVSDEQADRAELLTDPSSVSCGSLLLPTA
ncbi:coagulation factor IX-like [Salmo trutta]|uniref:coagulation factor IX-like n=1 Tax=Salmo trutta TaxID=8032 RepID=UPI0011302449|nr:coagulation factor IX-like [Salmo trutta]